MPNWYDIAEVKINGSGILAQNVNIDSSNGVEGARYLGGFGLVPNLIKGSNVSRITFDYTMEVTNEPQFLVSSGLRTNFYPLGVSPVQIVVAGITGSGVLERYSLQVTPNNPTKASAAYACYQSLSGANCTGITASFDQKTTSGISHFWSTSLLPDNYTEQLFSEFNYDFQANWNPVFTVGKKTPGQIHLLGITEEMSITRNIFKPISFSGQPSDEYFDQFTGVSLNELQAAIGNDYGFIAFNISGCPVKNSTLNLSVQNYITVKSSIRKVYN